MTDVIANLTNTTIHSGFKKYFTPFFNQSFFHKSLLRATIVAHSSATIN